jgi:cell division septation protein DedD
MVLDYREHKAVNKNRPRKQPVGIFFFSLLIAVVVAFTLGVVTGWLVFRPSSRISADNRAAVSADVNQKGAEAPAPGKPQLSPEPSGKTQDPILTFYETLPKGSKGVIGSGVNPAKPAENAPAKASPPPKPAPVAKPAPPAETEQQAREAVKAPAKSPEPSTPKETAVSKEGPVKENDGKKKFVVQVASYHVKKEAEELRDQLKTNGIAAYIVESNVSEKGTLYRVRVGKHLDLASAHELAGKTGRGSILISE